MATERELFGGAIVAQFPINLIDASDLRQIPDNQEVFLYPDSNDSIIIEILQRVSQPNDVEAVKFHFEALAHDNAATSSAIQNISVVYNGRGDRTPSPIMLRGSQSVPKFNAIAPDYVDIFMALFRVHSEQKSADLVVTANIPRMSEGSAGEERANAIASQFSTLVSSLRIIDYDLFVDSAH
ncbi:hypothetical protein V8E55_011201 [Tylopilus felleus]